MEHRINNGSVDINVLDGRRCVNISVHADTREISVSARYTPEKELFPQAYNRDPYITLHFEVAEREFDLPQNETILGNVVEQNTYLTVSQAREMRDALDSAIQEHDGPTLASAGVSVDRMGLDRTGGRGPYPDRDKATDEVL